MRRSLAFILSLCTLATTAQAQAPLVTRAEAVRFLFQSSGQTIPDPTGPRPVFVDVPTGSWQEKALSAAVERGMLRVDATTKMIGPDSPVSRGEYLWMLVMFFRLPAGPEHHFTDIPSGAPYAPFAGYVEQCRLFALEKKTLLHPEQSMTLGEAAQAVYALFLCAPSLRPRTTTPVGLFPRIIRTSSVASPPPGPQLLPRALLPIPSTKEQRKLQIISFINHERATAELLPLIRSPRLEQAAQEHAKDMYQRGYFGHFTPEGASYVDRIRNTGYLTLPPELCPCQAIFDLSSLLSQRSETAQHYFITKRTPVCNCSPRFALGENIARGQQTASIAVKQWMASTSHRQTILQPLFRETGIGVFGDVWVQTFGSLSLE